MKRWLLALTGLLLLLAPLKFSVPVNLQSLVVLPSSSGEWLFWSWPNQFAVMAAAVIGLLLVFERAPAARPGLLGVLALLWLLTQALAVPAAICRQTALDTLLHFGACAAVFFAAARCAREPGWEPWLLGALSATALLVCATALEQQFGGLDATRRYAAEHADLSDALRLKLTSRRVFGSFVSPNALAGFLAVAFAPVLAWLWLKADGKTTKITAVTLAGGVMGACLALSGSRGGFVAVAAGALAWLVLSKGSSRWRWGLAIVTALVLLGGVAWKGGFLHLGRSSLEARLDYWGGAVRIIRDYPWLGTGPGTFGSIYPKYKTALTEEAQLVHNNFLQMWSDSGVAAFVVFAALWAVGLWEAARLARRRGDAPSAALVAALVAWTVHGLIDSNLYVPGVALPAFALLGVVQGLARSGQPATTDSRRRVRLPLAVLAVLAVFWFEGRMCAASVAFGKAKAATDEARAQAALEAVRWAPYNPHYWAALGDAALQLNETEVAVGSYQRAIDLDPMRAAHHVRLARAYWLAGKRGPSVTALRWAAALNPTDKGCREQLNMVEESVRQDRGGLLQSPPF